MAIAAANAVLEPQAAGASNQVVVRGPGDVNIDVYRGYAQVTQDGSTSSGTINYIDGTNALAYTPSFIQVFRYSPPATGVVATVAAGSPAGTGYAVGSVVQILSPSYGAFNATASVATITAGGVPATWTVVNPGSGYAATSNLSTKLISGPGDNLATVTPAITATQTADTTAATIYPVSAASVDARKFTYQQSASDTSNHLMSIGFVAYK